MKEYSVILKMKGTGCSYICWVMANDEYEAIESAKQFQKEYRNLDADKLLVSEVEEE